MVDALEPVHRLIVLYLWLSYRLPLSFADQAKAFEAKDEVEQMIDFLLVSLQAGPRSPAPITLTKETASVATLNPFQWEYESNSDGLKDAPEMRQRVAQVHLPY